ncbi:MAG: Uma2 family endonuclease [Gemmatales bacterium]|nr:Uma2 family endonuclease [Gemmatales bacterium]MDW7994496.1 Uma2 family endonuclease [Gemmatales bacterium]
MTNLLHKPKVTPEELLRMPKDRRYELVDGELLEKPMSAISSAVGLQLANRLAAFVESNDLGIVFNADASYRCFPNNPDRVRRPDISFIRKERITPELWQWGHIPLVPDLVVEVLSPHDLSKDTEERIDDYLEAGVPLIWVVQPATRRVYVYRPDRPGLILGPHDELTGEPVLPGLRLTVREIFSPLTRYGIKPETKVSEVSHGDATR